MSKKISIFCFWLLVAGSASAVEPGKTGLLSDGFLLDGVEGKVILDDSNDKYFFELASDVNDSFGRVTAGSMLQILPSATLQNLSADANEHTEPIYKLLGRVTRYKNENFIFPMYFFPLTRIKAPVPEPEKEPKQQKAELTVNEPDDSIFIPQDVMDKLASRQIVRAKQVTKILDSQVDTVLANRTAVLKNQSDGNSVFVLDSLGRNVTEASLKALPSQALELAELKQKASPEPLRFRISGLLTKYKGDYYLLLQGANITYNYQNFSR